MATELANKNLASGELATVREAYETQSVTTYTFRNHFHPYVSFLLKKLNLGDLSDLLSIGSQQENDPDFFENTYTRDPENDPTVAIAWETKEIDLSVSGSYSIYNWELFFHVPLAIAVQLSKNQRFSEAQKWFHFIFDPTTDEVPDSANPVGRFWKFRYFREETSPESITELMELLAGSAGVESTDETLETLKSSIEEWLANPFSPHTVAKFRPLAYQYHVIMKYLDNLIAWGDSLFREFTIESINEATQLYVLASSILGDRPEEVPRLKTRPVRTYRELKDSLDEFGNALVEMENEFPLNANLSGTVSAAPSSRASSLYGASQSLYFCIPSNPALLAYWDTVSDRLYKIRHCMDIEGNVRQLPLFEPPIDPGMLVKAAAAGLDLSSVVAGLSQPVSNVRFRVILQKALEITSELKSLGAAVLSAFEKGDGEHLSNLRQTNELNLLKLVQDVKYLQWKEAEASTEALLASRTSAYQRYRHHQIILGVDEAEIPVEEDLTISREDLTEENFEDVYAELVTAIAPEIDLEDYRAEVVGGLGEAASSVTAITGAVDKALGVGSTELLQLNKTEDIELNTFMPLATDATLFSAFTQMATPLLAVIPEAHVHATPMGVGVALQFGGEELSKAAKFASELLQLGAQVLNYEATRASKLGAYKRRIDDWVLQNNLAAKELQQIGRQIIGALIREQIAEKEYENHKTQIEQTSAVNDYLTEKFTNEDLYLWMQGELTRTYYDCYKLAFDTASRAETTMKQELMRDDVSERSYLSFNYWDSGRKGLLSGEALYLDLKRMELDYTEKNKREFELTKHVSLAQLDPLALLQLKAAGSCEFEIPEWLYDLEAPGHYMRRIKTVSVSIPSVVGPYTGIHCTLSLQKSSIRKSALLSDGEYRRDDEDADDRFTDYFGSIQYIVTSHAQNDPGMFEVNLNDERYLPFEGAGAISTWTLELPSELRTFDYDTISDVILQIRYTARQGGAEMRDAAGADLKDRIEDAKEPVMSRLFSLRVDFSSEWNAFANAATGDLELTLEPEHFPYLVSPFDLTIIAAETKLYRMEDGRKLKEITSAIKGLPETLLKGGEADAPVVLDRATIEDLDDAYLVVRYSTSE